MAYIEMVHSFKRYHMGDITITANNDVSFGIERGELAIILGSSGAGKSTVLNILGGMDTNSEGKVIIDGVDISDFDAKQLTDYRRNNIGFVFQFYNSKRCIILCATRNASSLVGVCPYFSACSITFSTDTTISPSISSPVSGLK